MKTILGPVILTEIKPAISMSGPLLILIILGVVIAWLEISHRLKPHSPLQLRALDWKIAKSDNGLLARGWLEINNPHPRMEVMVPEFEIKPKVIGKEKVNEIQIKTVIRPDHPEENLRKAFAEAEKINQLHHFSMNIRGKIEGYNFIVFMIK